MSLEKVLADLETLNQHLIRTQSRWVDHIMAVHAGELILTNCYRCGVFGYGVKADEIWIGELESARERLL